MCKIHTNRQTARSLYTNCKCKVNCVVMTHTHTHTQITILNAWKQPTDLNCCWQAISFSTAFLEYLCVQPILVFIGSAWKTKQWAAEWRNIYGKQKHMSQTADIHGFVHVVKTIWFGTWSVLWYINYLKNDKRKPFKTNFCHFFPYLSSSNAQKIGLWNRSSWRTISEQNNWNESNSWTIGNEFRQRRVEVEWNSKNKVHIFRQWKRLNRTATLFTYLPACYGQRCLCVCDSIRMMVQQYWKQYAYTQNRTAWTKRRLLR